VTARVSITDLEELYGTLDVAAADLDEFRVVSVGGLPGVQVALDPSGRRHVLFAVSNDYAVRPDTRSAGVQSRSRELSEEGALRRFVDLACLETRLNHLFTAVAVEILATGGIDSHPDVVVADVLARWRDLFRRPPGSGLTVERRLGLFGELLVLKDLASASAAAIACWAGPTGHRHDFTSRLGDLEVKTTADPTASRVQIHGLDQLTAPPGGSLHLIVIAVERVPVAGQSILEVVDDLLALGVDALALYDRLGSAGVSATDLSRDDVRLRELVRRAYIADETMPRLTLESISGWPVDGIDYVHYGIDLRRAGPALTPAALDDLLNTFAVGVR
jgi:hypothetical protein